MNRSDVYAAKSALADQLLTRTAASGTMTRFARHAVMAARPQAAAFAELPHAIHGVGVGRKITHGKRSGPLSVRLYVTVKLPASAISRGDLLPKHVAGVPTDVVEAAPPLLFQALSNRGVHRPLVGGISIGNRVIGAGTLAYFCRSVRAGDDRALLYVLSNNHVLAVNDTLAPPEPVTQPGQLDAPPPRETVAHLARAVRIARGANAGNLVDAAIAQVAPRQRLRREILNVGRVAGIAKAAEDDLVCKSGRTTGVTHGVIDDESVDELVGLDPTDPTLVARFRNQLRIVRAPAPRGRYDDGDTEFGRPGDSGSLVVTADAAPRAAGLFFAGATGYGLANPIDAVLQALQIELV